MQETFVSQSKEDRIDLTIPSKAEYVSVVRLTSSAIASRIGFDIEEIEDIKVAIAEACIMIIKNSANRNIHIKFGVIKDRLTIKIQAEQFTNQEKDNDIMDINDSKNLSILIIESLMDEVKYENNNGLIYLNMMKKIRMDA